MRRYLGAALLGLVGAAILIELGLWQVRRLAWKQDMLARIETRIAAAPVALPATPEQAADQFLAVSAEGVIGTPELDVLTSRKELGAGYRIIAPFTTTAGRRLLVDRGWVPEDRRQVPRPGGPVHLVGNLAWPDETDSFTPAPDAKTGLWFARDLPAMAKALGTEPVLIVARAATGDGVEPMPVSTEGIPDNHLQYAITWFSLAAVWLGMTALWLWRIHRRTG